MGPGPGGWAYSVGGIPDHLPVFDISADQSVEELDPKQQMSQHDAPHERAMPVAGLSEPDTKARKPKHKFDLLCPSLTQTWPKSSRVLPRSVEVGQIWGDID